MLKEKLKNYSIILASGSPRRQQFLKDLDIPFTIKLKEIEEVFPDHLKGEEITNYLAELKGSAFNDINENEIIITSDTIVWSDHKALGKPKDAKNAFEMLQSMSGKSHEVYTSVSLKGKNFCKTFSDKTIVWFKVLTEEEIHYYINTFKPFDKAGSYGIQDWIGFIGIDKIEGSYFNVMGLPVHKLYKELMNLPD